MYTRIGTGCAMNLKSFNHLIIRRGVAAEKKTLLQAKGEPTNRARVRLGSVQPLSTLCGSVMDPLL